MKTRKRVEEGHHTPALLTPQKPEPPYLTLSFPLSLPTKVTSLLPKDWYVQVVGYNRIHHMTYFVVFPTVVVGVIISFCCFSDFS